PDYSRTRGNVSSAANLNSYYSAAECRGSLVLFFFFFQAEDGIRDLYVTGVQTCALPISSRDFHSDTSMMVPSRERMIVGTRSLTSPSLRKVGTRLRTRSISSFSLPGFGR